MIWIFAAALIVAAALSPGFRKIGLVLAGAVIVIIVVLILLNDRDKQVSPPIATVQTTPIPRQKMMDHDEYVIEMQDKKDPDAKRRIPLTEVRFGEIMPATIAQSAGIPSADVSPAAIFRSVQARLYNDSTRFTLTNYSYDLAIQDCVQEHCTIVYDQRQQGIPVVIPPMQARDVTIALKPDAVTGAMPFKLIGKARIQLTCSDIRAYDSAATVDAR